MIEKTKPNFIIILTDDQGYEDIGCFGSPLIKTPHLDQMAAEGMKFTDYYGQPICGPSRCSLMTGCYPLRVAERGNVKNIHPVLHENELTLAELLKQEGYTTAMFGKWDLAGHYPNVHEDLQLDLLPHHRGFDLHFGTPASNDSWSSTALIQNGEIVEYPIDLTESTTKRYFERAVEFIGEYQDDPFFVYLAPNMPHIELHAGKEFSGKSRRGLYGDVIEELDYYTGILLDRLKDWNLSENTYVVYASDNGPWLREGIHGGSSHPLRSGKVSTWDGGPRVPCIMWAPGHIPSGLVCSKIATSMDLFATVVELAGGHLPQDRCIDGKSMLHLMNGDFEKSDPQKTYFYYIHTHLQAVRQGRWKLILERPEHPAWLSIFSPNTHIAPWDDIGISKPQLFDLVADPSESRDISSSHPGKVEDLLYLANQARSEIGDYDCIGTGARFYDDGPHRPDAAEWILNKSDC